MTRYKCDQKYSKILIRYWIVCLNCNIVHVCSKCMTINHITHSEANWHNLMIPTFTLIRVCRISRSTTLFDHWIINCQWLIFILAPSQNFEYKTEGNLKLRTILEKQVSKPAHEGFYLGRLSKRFLWSIIIFGRILNHSLIHMHGDVIWFFRWVQFFSSE